MAILTLVFSQASPIEQTMWDGFDLHQGDRGEATDPQAAGLAASRERMPRF